MVKEAESHCATWLSSVPQSLVMGVETIPRKARSPDTGDNLCRKKHLNKIADENSAIAEFKHETVLLRL
jgi:hypothetical protein